MGFFLPLLQRSALLCIERSVERVFERERETTMLLTDFGYKKSMTDSSLFVLDNSNDSVNMVGLLTDDLLLVMEIR